VLAWLSKFSIVRDQHRTGTVAVAASVHAAKKALPEYHRSVGFESRKSYSQKIESGFFDKYLSGSSILEIGYKGGLNDVVPIVPQAVGVDLDYPGYNGKTLPFPDESQDAIYTSHCFEHIADYKHALRDWFRVLKIGGFLVIVVPHQHLFERRRNLPSRWNLDHKRFYTPASLLREIEEVFAPNSYRVRHMMDNDLGFDYSVTPLGAGVGCFEIEIVLEKLKQPVWTLDDGTTRDYPAGEFHTNCLERKHGFFLETDFSTTDICPIFGPYVPLAAGDYEVRYFFEAVGIGGQELEAPIVFDVARDGGRRVVSVKLVGPAGAEVMRHGALSLRFTNDSPDSPFEFRVFTSCRLRVFTSGRPFQGSFRFFGVSLARLWPER